MGDLDLEHLALEHKVGSLQTEFSNAIAAITQRLLAVEEKLAAIKPPFWRCGYCGEGILNEQRMIYDPSTCTHVVHQGCWKRKKQGLPPIP